MINVLLSFFLDQKKICLGLLYFVFWNDWKKYEEKEKRKQGKKKEKKGKQEKMKKVKKELGFSIDDKFLDR